MENQENMYNTKDNRDLSALADSLLKRNGFSIWGQQRNEDTWKQCYFEKSMPTGAYGRNSERRRKA